MVSDSAAPTASSDNTASGPPEMFEWSVWDEGGRELATGLTDSEQRARGQVTGVMRDTAASWAAIALVDLDDGRYELLRSIANAYRDTDSADGLRWENLDA